MELPRGTRDRLVARYRDTHQVPPDLVERLVDDVLEAAGEETTPSPFAISWMDSYLAHWEVREQLHPSARTGDEVARLVGELIDERVDARLAEIRDILGGVRASPPDGGPPPEPGVPPTGPSGPVGPSPILRPFDEGGREEGMAAGVPPRFTEPPDGGPPEPGAPPVGPQAGPLEENPWILYWFVSVKAPMLLDVIDAHLTRRLAELGAELR